MTRKWLKVSKAEPCPICGHTSWCKLSVDGTVALCGRIEPGSFKTAKNGGGFLHRLIDKPRPESGGAEHPRRQRIPACNPAANGSHSNWKSEAERLRGQLTDEHLPTLSEATGIPAEAWAKLSPGWADGNDLRRLKASGAGWADSYPEGAWCFAEHSGDGRIVGLSFRDKDARKGSPAGGKRGLTVPEILHGLPDPVLIVEGASDVAACTALGLSAVGRPSNRAGADDLSVLLDGRSVLVVGERDGKPGGAWPGRDGAKAVAGQLASHWGESVQWTLPPLDAKDVRDWLRGRAASGLDVKDKQAMQAAGQELLSALQAAAKTVKPEKRTQADALVSLAGALYRLGTSHDGEAFAVPREGPQVALPLRSGLRSNLAKAYRKQTGKTPSTSALADALQALEGMAADAEAEPLALRVATHAGGLVLDLGDATGKAVVVNADPAGSWAVEAVSPVLFRRTALTSALPEPVPAEPIVLNEFRSLLNVNDETWPLVVGWMVAALIENIPHCVLLLGGEQGTGKSKAAGFVVEIVDPSAATRRSEPRDVEQWAIAAAGSWTVCIDNVSHISAWLSDAICKAVTGDGLVRRKLYTDSDLSVLAFKRCIVLTSIDCGTLRGDLGDRLLLVDLERIPDDRRRTEAELDEAYRVLRPRLLGALLTAAGRTLAALPAVKLNTLPRMADFAKVLAALDVACPELTGRRALDQFIGQRRRVASEVVETDAVATALMRLMETRDAWQGTAGELLAALTPNPAPRNWPRTPRAMAGSLSRLRPALATMGILHYPPDQSDKTRTHRVEKRSEQPPKPPVPPTDGESGVPQGNLAGRNVGGGTSPTTEQPSNRPVKSPVSGPERADLGEVGGAGGHYPTIPSAVIHFKEDGEL